MLNAYTSDLDKSRISNLQEFNPARLRRVGRKAVLRIDWLWISDPKTIIDSPFRKRFPNRNCATVISVLGKRSISHRIQSAKERNLIFENEIQLRWENASVAQKRRKEEALRPKLYRMRWGWRSIFLWRWKMILKPEIEWNQIELK